MASASHARYAKRAMNAKTPSPRNWSRRDDLLVRYVSPAVAAEKLGISVKEINARRIELGLGEFSSHRKKRRKFQQKKGSRKKNDSAPSRATKSARSARS
jgi:hypothetical protein